MYAPWTPWTWRLLNDDLTDVGEVRPSSSGSATVRALTAEDVTELAELEKRRVPIGFTAPEKPKRKRKAKS